MAKQWFVGKTKPGQELIAQRHLKYQHFTTYLPMYVREWMKFPRLKPFLPSYIFINMDITQAWVCIKYTMGMSSLLCTGEIPQAISPSIIDEIKSREVYGIVKLPPAFVCKFKKGEKVIIKGGGIEAIFGEPKDSRRADIFISLFNSPHKLTVEMSKLKAAPFVGTAAA